MSDTPRTDAQIVRMDNRHFLWSPCSWELVEACRTLERELAKAHKHHADLRDEIGTMEGLVTMRSCPKCFTETYMAYCPNCGAAANTMLSVSGERKETDDHK